MTLPRMDQWISSFEAKDASPVVRPKDRATLVVHVTIQALVEQCQVASAGFDIHALLLNLSQICCGQILRIVKVVNQI